MVTCHQLLDLTQTPVCLTWSPNVTKPDTVSINQEIQEPIEQRDANYYGRLICDINACWATKSPLPCFLGVIGGSDGNFGWNICSLWHCQTHSGINKSLARKISPSVLIEFVSINNHKIRPKIITFFWPLQAFSWCHNCFILALHWSKQIWNITFYDA